jgi:hypothetical protein
VLEKPDWPETPPFRPDDFQRYDESSDAFFYESPRFVTHIDDGAIAALTKYAGNPSTSMIRSWIFCSTLSEGERVDGSGPGQITHLALGLGLCIPSSITQYYHYDRCYVELSGSFIQVIALTDVFPHL